MLGTLRAGAGWRGRGCRDRIHGAGEFISLSRRVAQFLSLSLSLSAFFFLRRGESFGWGESGVGMPEGRSVLVKRGEINDFFFIEFIIPTAQGKLLMVCDT